MPEKWAYGKTEAACLATWRTLLGLDPVRLRPGSVAQFVEAVQFWTWLGGRVRQLSLERYKTAWNNQLGPVFGTVLLSEINPTTAQSLLLECGNSASVRELNKILLGQIVKLAVAHGKCGPEAPMSVTLAKIGQRTPKHRVEVIDRCATVLANAAGTYLEGPLWVMFTLGLRWGEVCGLKGSDLSQGVLTIQRQRNNKVGEVPYPKARKAGQARYIGLPAELLEQLEGYRNGDIYFFHGPDGDVLNYAHAERQLRPFQVEDRVTMHDFRSAAICNLYGRVDEKTYYNLFGHKAIEQSRQYLDESARQTREALRILVNI